MRLASAVIGALCIYVLFLPHANALMDPVPLCQICGLGYDALDNLMQSLGLFSADEDCDTLCINMCKQRNTAECCPPYITCGQILERRP